MPTLALLGLNHRSAPVELREQLAFADEMLPDALQALREIGEEAYILSTCNRTELYLVGDALDPHGALIEFLATARQVPAADLAAHAYFSTGRDAARQLFRVACGLDSMVLGEDQVLGQVRSAFQHAQGARTIGRVLGRLLPLAIEAGRRARTETNIGRGALSPSSVAVSLAQRTLGDLRSRSVLVIGAGDAGKATARSLMHAGVERIVVTNRSSTRAHDITETVPALAVPYAGLTDALLAADIAISCTGASEHILSADDLRGVMERRPDRPLLCIDIAVPRDLDPEIAAIPAVHLYNIDDLEEACGDNREERTREAAAAEKVVEEAVAEYGNWLETRELDTAIGALYEQAETIRRHEIDRTVGRIPALSAEDRSLIDLMTSSLVRRLLHGPVSALRDQADGSNSRELARLARELFGLSADETTTPPTP
jgi:glutamyl-tRNA reductase